MGEPAISLGAVPMLDFRRNRNNHDFAKRNRSFVFLLIPTFTDGTDQKLTAAAFGVMDMPVIAAARFKGDIVKKNAVSFGFVSRFK